MQYFDSGARYDSGIRYDEPMVANLIQPTHMIDLHRFLTNPFDDPGISLAELLAFSTDHLQRLTATDPALFAARIPGTSAALEVVGSAFTDDETKLALRKARKLAKNNFRAALPRNVGKLAVAVENKYGEGAAEFVECFPHGRKVFSDISDDKLVFELQTLINGVTAHAADLGAPVVAGAEGLLTGWVAVYAPSETATGAKATTQTAKNAARAALQLELFKNLLTIALKFPRQPAQLDVFMQSDLLADHPSAPVSAPAPAPAPAPPGP
jgi:hypothetical protein